MFDKFTRIRNLILTLKFNVVMTDYSAGSEMTT